MLIPRLLLFLSLMILALMFMISCDGEGEEDQPQGDDVVEKTAAQQDSKLSPGLGAIEKASKPDELPSDSSCSGQSLMDLKDCHFYPLFISQKDFHYFSLSCEKTSLSDQCRLYMRGFLFWWSASLHGEMDQALKTESLSDRELPPSKIRLWLTADTQNLRWNQAQSLVLKAQTGNVLIEEENIPFTYFPLDASSFSALNSFLEEFSELTSSSVMVLTLHEDLHEFSKKPHDLKNSDHRAIGDVRVLMSLLIAAKHLAEREKEAPSWSALSPEALKALKRLEVLLPWQEDAVSQSYKKFHGGYCVVLSNYFQALLGMTALNCGL